MSKLWNFLKQKKVIAGIAVILVVIFFIARSGNKSAGDIQTDTIKKQDLKQTVLATGQVTSKTDLSLTFKSSGIIDRVNVKVGDAVKSGQILANLDQKDQVARLTQARGALKQAEANYQKVIDGASSEEVTVARVTLENAKKSLEDTKRQQQVLVDNAYKTLLNSGLEAVSASGNLNATAPTISGLYNSTQQGQYTIIQEGQSFYVTGLESVGNQSINTSVPVPLPLGTRGLYIQFPSNLGSSKDQWVVSIPNTKSSYYVANYNAYQSALETQRVQNQAAENAVASAQASLELKMAKARPAELDGANAQILSAQGQVQQAAADYENTLMRAPSDGTITKVDAKVGQQAVGSQPLVVLQDVGNLHVEANISEANIALVKTNQPVEITFDALGSDRKFKGTVQQIDPASTVVSGVVNYKVTVGLDKLDEIKPGMTANLNILAAEKNGVLSIPSRAIITDGGKKYARVITDAKKKTYKQVEVSTGLEADGGLVEITSGLENGQEVVTFIKTK
jgi:HlyD family secretion protein